MRNFLIDVDIVALIMFDTLNHSGENAQAILNLLRLGMQCL